jgi:hypothetical protein
VYQIISTPIFIANSTNLAKELGGKKLSGKCPISANNRKANESWKSNVGISVGRLVGGADACLHSW